MKASDLHNTSHIIQFIYYGKQFLLHYNIRWNKAQSKFVTTNESKHVLTIKLKNHNSFMILFHERSWTQYEVTNHRECGWFFFFNLTIIYNESLPNGIPIWDYTVVMVIPLLFQLDQFLPNTQFSNSLYWLMEIEVTPT